MLPILASTEREQAICEADVKMTTWLVLIMSDPLIFERTTPGIARKLALAISTSVDWQSRKTDGVITLRLCEYEPTELRLPTLPIASS